MKNNTLFTTTVLAVLLSGAALGIGAAVDSPPSLMSPGDYARGKKAIEAETRVALARCRDESLASRDVCKAQARGQERILKAELQARYHGTVTALQDVRLARARAGYEVAKARCGSRAGEERIDCLRAAREHRNRSVAEAKPAST